MTNINEDDENEDLDEEDQARKDAAISSELSRIMAQSRVSNIGLTIYEVTKKDWTFLGSVSGMEFYIGSICSEIMYKKPKTFKGKVRFWDEHIRVFKNEKSVAMYKVEYIGGFRENLNDAIERMALHHSA